MQIKANRTLYRGAIISFGIVFFILESLSYFLGFEINAKSFLFYLIAIVSTALFCVILFFIIDKLNRKYFIFDDEKIILKTKDCEKVLLYFYQILYTKYYNYVDILNCDIAFGYVEIVYKLDQKDMEAKKMQLYLSKKYYKMFFLK